MLRLLALSLVIGMIWPYATAQASGRHTHPAQIHSIAVAQIEPQKCAVYVGFLPGPFFQDLNVSATAGGVEFRHKKAVVTSFPNRTTIKLWAFPTGCEPGASVFPMAAVFRDYLFHLRFRAYWQRRTTEVPVEGTFDEILPPDWNEYANEYHGDYTIDIPSSNAPLTDTLVVCSTPEEVERWTCVRFDLASHASSSRGAPPKH